MNPSFDIGIRARFLLSLENGEVRPECDRFVGIRGSSIAQISPYRDELGKQSKTFIDASSHVVMPGLVNAHTHLAMTLFRGLEDELPFHDWLFRRILPLEQKIADREFVRVGTGLALLESIRFGVTTVNEMYFYAEEAAEAIDRACTRGVVSQVFAQFPIPEDAALGSDRASRFRRLREKFANHPRVQIALGPHAPYTCDDAIIKQVAELSRDTGAAIHIHVSETEKENKDSMMMHQATPTERLNRLGALTSKTIAAHGVHLNDSDMGLFAQAGASVVYNPDSNMKLGSGIAPIRKYLNQGVNVALGTDGAASNNNLNLFHAMNVGAKLQKLFSAEERAMTASDAIRASTWGGAQALGLGRLIGSLEAGKRADLIAVDLDYPHLQPIHDLASQLVYSAQGLEVDLVLCDGKPLYRNGEYTTLDRERIRREVEAQRVRVQKETEALRDHE